MTILSRLESEIAAIDAEFRTLHFLSDPETNDSMLQRRWELSIMRDEMRAEHARMTASFDTCTVDNHASA